MATTSVTRTIRIEDDLNRAIEKLAKEDRTSVNFVINSALRQFIEWDMVTGKFGLATFPLSLVNKLFQKYSDVECEEIGKWAAHELFKPFTEYQFGSFTFETSLEAIRKLGKYTGRFKFDDTQNGGQHIIFLKHSSGSKCSHYYLGLSQTLFGEMLKLNVRTELTEDLCIAKIDLAKTLVQSPA